MDVRPHTQAQGRTIVLASALFKSPRCGCRYFFVVVLPWLSSALLKSNQLPKKQRVCVKESGTAVPISGKL